MRYIDYKVIGELNLEEEIKKVKENNKNKYKITTIKVILMVLKVFSIVIILNGLINLMIKSQ